ncbi:hypothetical protein M0R45_022095 [Rubus argutus]|uniref:Uncharacterized protein n=1 Tax=Rubus argutus TaxID=59490 RepID=A0AAW1XFK8_RUBAR
MGKRKKNALSLRDSSSVEGCRRGRIDAGVVRLNTGCDLQQQQRRWLIEMCGVDGRVRTVRKEEARALAGLCRLQQLRVDSTPDLGCRGSEFQLDQRRDMGLLRSMTSAAAASRLRKAAVEPWALQ